MNVAPNTDVELDVELLNSRDLPSDFAMYTKDQLTSALLEGPSKLILFLRVF